MEKGNVKREDYNYNQNSELLSLAKKGDNDAMNKLIEINLPLVASISKKFLNRGYEYEDIFQIGSIGLVKAINNFDLNNLLCVKKRLLAIVNKHLSGTCKNNAELTKCKYASTSTLDFWNERKNMEKIRN